METAGQYEIEPFVPGEPGYRAMADLLNRVWPDWPASAAWAARFDARAAPERRPGRAVVAEAGRAGRLVGLVEWRGHHWIGDGAHFQLTVVVDPDHRRRGLGERLLQHALGALPADRSAVVEAATTEDQVEAIQFLERRGFTPRLRMVQSELDLAAFDSRPFEAAAARLAAEGVVVRSLGASGAEDEGLLRGLHALQADVRRDAPGGGKSVLDDFDRWRLAYRENPDLLPEGQLLALDGARIVGMTQLWGSQATDAVLLTGFTGVARGHRRRGIATALKARALGWARGLRTAGGTPLVVRTGNADGSPMVAINLRLGFLPRPARLVLERRLGEVG